MTFAARSSRGSADSSPLTTVALHLLAWRRPPESPLPTARFAPERPVRMVSRAVGQRISRCSRCVSRSSCWSV
jgi:hypothetical protein